MRKIIREAILGTEMSLFHLTAISSLCRFVGKRKKSPIILMLTMNTLSGFGAGSI